MILGSVRPALTMVATLVVTSSLSAQSGPNTSAKYATAPQAPSSGIRVDGRLDEAVWSQAPPITDFVQKEPVEGALHTERTGVRFVYDDKALYVGARMYSSGGVASTFRSTAVVRWEWRPGSTLHAPALPYRSRFASVLERAAPAAVFGSFNERLGRLTMCQPDAPPVGWGFDSFYTET